MEDIKDFESFYNTNLQAFLKDLELKSNDALKWSVAGIASIFLSIVCFIIGELFAGFLFIVLLAISVYKYSQKKDDFTYDYKKTIINEIVKYLNPGAVYNQSKKFLQEIIKKVGCLTMFIIIMQVRI